eukprot:FR742347.1.p1 GENE.FR742347.1~~FR742347.1.p1  ORF type:complete len:251 (+),score=44.04 FR742347.1:27-755(+)
MLPNASEHIKQLQQICAQSARNLMELGQEWETHRKPMIEQLRQHKDQQTTRKEKCKAMIEEMKRCRGEMQQMAGEVRDKDERAKLLADELEKMPKNVNRNLYTYRIMDIINSISKQKQEIDKIIDDVRQVQKDINSIGEKLQRAEVLADEKIFTSANRQKKDPAMVQSYRYLSDLRARFDDLIGVVSDIGKKESEARDLEGKTAQLLERVSKNNIERILADLSQVKTENQALISQIKANQRG